MGKRKKSKDHHNISKPNIDIFAQPINESHNIPKKTNRNEIDKMIIHSTRAEFSCNFAKWMNDILHNIQLGNQDETSMLIRCLRRSSHCHAEMCKQYFSDHVDSIFTSIIGPAVNEDSLLLKLKLLQICMQFAPSIFGPYKAKIDTFLSKQINPENLYLNCLTMPILSHCFSYLPILGSGGTNNQNHIISWNAELSRHLNELDQILEKFEEHSVTFFRMHCLTIIHLLKLDLNFLIEVPTDRILAMIAKVTSFGFAKEQFRKIDIDVEINLSLDVLSILHCLVLKLRDLLWPYSANIFKLLIKFLRFSNEISNLNSLICKLKCRIYDVIADCLLLNYSCKLRPILADFCESALQDCRPQRLNDVEANHPILDNISSKNKKRKHYAVKSMNLIGSLPTNKFDLFKIEGHDWLDFEALELTCLAALNVLKAISAMDAMLIDADKNEIKRNRVELMIPIWSFTIDTLIKLSTYQDGAHPYGASECRHSLYALMQQHVSDNLFYSSRFCGRAYIAISGGKEDNNLKIKLLCHNALSIYNQHCASRTLVTLNPLSEFTNESILTSGQASIDTSIFSSCRNSTFTDNQCSQLKDKTTKISNENQHKAKDSVQKLDEMQELNISQNSNCSLVGTDASVTLSESQYSYSDNSFNENLNVSNISINNESIETNADQEMKQILLQIDNTGSKSTISEIDRNIDSKSMNGIIDDQHLSNKSDQGKASTIFNKSFNPVLRQDLTLNQDLDLGKKSEVEYMLATFVNSDPD